VQLRTPIHYGITHKEQATLFFMYTKKNIGKTKARNRSGLPNVRDRFRKVNKHFKETFGHTIPQFDGKRGTKAEITHYEKYSERLRAWRRNPAYDALAIAPRILISVRAPVTYYVDGKDGRGFRRIGTHVEDVPSTPYIHGMHLPPKGNLTSDQIAMIKERVVRDFDHIIILNSDVIAIVHGEITAADVSVHVMEDQDVHPGRRPMRDFTVLTYDDDATVDSILKDEVYRSIREGTN